MAIVFSAAAGESAEAGGYPWGDERLTPKEVASYFDAAFLAGEWRRNTQNTSEHPWGAIHDSADLGRFVYEYYPTRRWARGNVVWGQAVGVMGLLALHARTGNSYYEQAAKMAGEYMKTLQILDEQDPRLFGAMREKNPQDDISLPRDAATGGMGFAALYRHTGDKEYLYRARLAVPISGPNSPNAALPALSTSSGYRRHKSSSLWPCRTMAPGSVPCMMGTRSGPVISIARWTRWRLFIGIPESQQNMSYDPFTGLGTKAAASGAGVDGGAFSASDRQLIACGQESRTMHKYSNNQVLNALPDGVFGRRRHSTAKEPGVCDRKTLL